MKYLKYILPTFFSIVLISSCASDSEEKEVYNEEPISTEIVSTEDTTVIDEKANEVEVIDNQSEDGDNGAMKEPIESKEEKVTANKSSNETVKPKTTKSVSIDRSVGVKLKAEKEFDLMGFAAEEVVILKKEDCAGENCGNKIQLQSYNSEKSIITVVMIKWKEGSDKKNELREYKLKPEALLDIGCSHSCNEDNDKYTWKIVSAIYN